MKLAFSRPGKPTDHPFIEAFNGRLRDECLDQHWCASLEDAQTTIEAWRVEYNTVRPHTALRTPLPLLHDRRCKHPPQRYRQRTSAMAAGLTSRRWMVRELLALPLPPEPSGAI